MGFASLTLMRDLGNDYDFMKFRLHLLFFASHVMVDGKTVSFCFAFHVERSLALS